MKIDDLLSDDNEFFVSVKFSHDQEIQKLNKEFLNRDAPTDVLSFNMNEKQDGDDYYLGDVIINLDQASRQAKEFGNSLEEEIAELVRHGVLHLLGVHHPGDDHE